MKLMILKVRIYNTEVKNSDEINNTEIKNSDEINVIEVKNVYEVNNAEVKHLNKTDKTNDADNTDNDADIKS